jgi:hypothetical protein
VGGAAAAAAAAVVTVGALLPEAVVVVVAAAASGGVALCVWLRKSAEEVEVNAQPGTMQTKAAPPAGMWEGAPSRPGTVEAVARKEKAEVPVLSEVDTLGWAAVALRLPKLPAAAGAGYMPPVMVRRPS